MLLFFTGPLQYVPEAALGAVLVKAAISLLDLRALKTFSQVDRRELAISLLATLGVVAVGAVQAILVAVILALACVSSDSFRDRKSRFWVRYRAFLDCTRPSGTRTAVHNSRFSAVSL